MVAAPLAPTVVPRVPTPQPVVVPTITPAGQALLDSIKSDRTAQWVKNLVRNPRVRVRVGDRTFDARARPLNPARDSEAWQTAQRLAREKYGWGDGLPVELMPDEAT